jgi:hypothetical protein
MTGLNYSRWLRVENSWLEFSIPVRQRATIMPTRRASPGRMSKKRDKVSVREKQFTKINCILFYGDVNTTLLPFYGMSIDSIKGETVTAQRIGVVPLLLIVFARAALRSGEYLFQPALLTRDSSVWRPAHIFETSCCQFPECRPRSPARWL